MGFNLLNIYHCVRTTVLSSNFYFENNYVYVIFVAAGTRTLTTSWVYLSQATFTDLRNFMRNVSNFFVLLFTYGPQSFVHRWTEK